MLKKLAAISTAALMLLSLTACGGKDDDPQDETELSIAASFAEQETVSDAATNAPDETSETIIAE